MARHTAPPAPDPRPGRLHGLDALRGAALLLGILLHSLLPFIPGVPWLVTDSATSAWLGIPTSVIHLFRMVVFMLLAGYFGRMVVHRRGTGSYLRDRVVRVLLPLIVFWPLVVLPLGLLAVVNAELRGVPLTPPSTPQDPLMAINPGQLWFLAVLLQCVTVTLLVRAAAHVVVGPERRTQLASRLGGLLTAPGGVALAAVPYATCLALQGHVMGGVVAPQSLLPEVPALTAYLGAFGVGWALHAHPGALGRLAGRWAAHLVAAAALTPVGLAMSDPAWALPLPIVAAVLALAAWCWAYGLVGSCVRFVSRERPALRYLADASYWMYLVHLPLLVAFEILLVDLPWPIAAKLGLTWLVVGAVLVVSYHLLVRSTPLGRWLNGRRHPFVLRPGRPHRRPEESLTPR